MKIKKTKFKDLIIIENNKFKDTRGFFSEILRENFVNKKFPFMVISSSKKNVIRGIHFQSKKSQGKFVTVIKGKVLDIAVDLRKKSKTFGKYFSIILTEKNSKSIYIPEGFGHGFCGLNKENIVLYNCTNYRHKNSENGIIWNDKKINIKWPIKKPIISKKDKNNSSLNDLIKLKIL